MTFEPKIIAFLCTWCSYTGADTAGIARLKSPANVRAIRVPCSGRVSPELVMRTFDQGADGVLVLGCHIGECHYDTGNHRAAKRLPILHSLMQYAGLEAERFRLDWVSASEGERFSRITTEFVEAVRSRGPVSWRVPPEHALAMSREIAAAEPCPYPETDCAGKTEAIRHKARELLSSGAVTCVIGYEVNPRGRTRPSFAYTVEDVERLVWNPDVTNNLTHYIPIKFRRSPIGPPEPQKPVAVVVKPCDCKAINVQLAENHYTREQIHVIGVTCDGLRDADGNTQTRCTACQDRVPLVYDTLIGEPPALSGSRCPVPKDPVEALPLAERMEFWLSEFDRCIRCYACRQACPMCNCPTCLYERDDSIWVGLGIRLNEKRTFHLGRAWHHAGRCIGCNECERACPMKIPISLLNRKLAGEIEKAFGHRAGYTVAPSPIVTILSGEYKEGT
ncbi:MAG: hydrogenase iron-sulfur subunit [Chloroflexota bacterium]